MLTVASCTCIAPSTEVYGMRRQTAAQLKSTTDDSQPTHGVSPRQLRLHLPPVCDMLDGMEVEPQNAAGLLGPPSPARGADLSEEGGLGTTPDMAGILRTFKSAPRSRGHSGRITIATQLVEGRTGTATEEARWDSVDGRDTPCVGCLTGGAVCACFCRAPHSSDERSQGPVAVVHWNRHLWRHGFYMLLVQMAVWNSRWIHGLCDVSCVAPVAGLAWCHGHFVGDGVARWRPRGDLDDARDHVSPPGGCCF